MMADALVAIADCHLILDDLCKVPEHISDGIAKYEKEINAAVHRQKIALMEQRKGVAFKSPIKDS